MKLLCWFSKAVGQWWTIAALLPISHVTGVTTIDLSKELPLGNIYNADAVELSSFLTRDIRRYLVIQSGEIVMEYERDNVEEGELYELWSASKTFFSLVMGAAIASTNLTLEKTLADIFPEDSAWALVSDPLELECKKSTTVRELLTMTSGMNFPFGDWKDALNPFNPDFLNLFDFADSFGENLPDALQYPSCNATDKGEMHYFADTMIPSYVFMRATGKTPKDYADSELMGYLGIGPDDWDWLSNDEGVTNPFANMQMNARQMAKLTQLVLQKGYLKEGQPLLDESWLDASLSGQTVSNDVMPGFSYGYLWWEFFEEDTNVTSLMVTPEDEELAVPVGHIWCALGLFGQYACLNEEMDRVVVIQRSNTVFDYDTERSSAQAYWGFSPDFTFDGEAVVITDSGGVRSSCGLFVLGGSLVLSAVWLLV